MKNQKQTGFTLIELMIVIAIIGILMAYAIPAYRDYTVRSKRGECNAMVDGLKTPMSEYFYNKGVFPNAASDMGFSANPVGTSVTSIGFTQAGTTGTATCNMNAAAGGGTVAWLATAAAGSASIVWTCTDGIAAAQNVCPK